MKKRDPYKKGDQESKQKKRERERESENIVVQEQVLNLGLKPRSIVVLIPEMRRFALPSLYIYIYIYQTSIPISLYRLVNKG